MERMRVISDYLNLPEYRNHLQVDQLFVRWFVRFSLYAAALTLHFCICYAESSCYLMPARLHCHS